MRPLQRMTQHKVSRIRRQRRLAPRQSRLGVRQVGGLLEQHRKNLAEISGKIDFPPYGASKGACRGVHAVLSASLAGSTVQRLHGDVVETDRWRSGRSRTLGKRV